MTRGATILAAIVMIALIATSCDNAATTQPSTMMYRNTVDNSWIYVGEIDGDYVSVRYHSDGVDGDIWAWTTHDELMLTLDSPDWYHAVTTELPAGTPDPPPAAEVELTTAWAGVRIDGSALVAMHCVDLDTLPDGYVFPVGR